MRQWASIEYVLTRMIWLTGCQHFVKLWLAEESYLISSRTLVLGWVSNRWFSRNEMLQGTLPFSRQAIGACGIQISTCQWHAGCLGFSPDFFTTARSESVEALLWGKSGWSRSARALVSILAYNRRLQKDSCLVSGFLDLRQFLMRVWRWSAFRMVWLRDNFEDNWSAT